MTMLAVTSIFRPGWLWVAVAAWVVAAAAGAGVMRRRGHDGFAWAVVFMAFGPLAVPVAVSADRRRPADPPPGDHPGPLDVLVAVDPAAAAEAGAAVDRLVALTGDRASSFTLAAVLDYQAGETPRGRDETGAARDRLAMLAARLQGRVGVPVECVVLHGPPATTLERFAAAGGFELVVAGDHHRGADPLAGRVGRHLVRHCPVPVLVGAGPELLTTPADRHARNAFPPPELS